MSSVAQCMMWCHQSRCNCAVFSCILGSQQQDRATQNNDVMIMLMWKKTFREVVVKRDAIRYSRTATPGLSHSRESEMASYSATHLSSNGRGKGKRFTYIYEIYGCPPQPMQLRYVCQTYYKRQFTGLFPSNILHTITETWQETTCGEPSGDKLLERKREIKHSWNLEVPLVSSGTSSFSFLRAWERHTGRPGLPRQPFESMKLGVAMNFANVRTIPHC